MVMFVKLAPHGLKTVLNVLLTINVPNVLQDSDSMDRLIANPALIPVGTVIMLEHV
jgi:hypothetical protein